MPPFTSKAPPLGILVLVPVTLVLLAVVAIALAVGLGVFDQLGLYSSTNVLVLRSNRRMGVRSAEPE